MTNDGITKEVILKSAKALNNDLSKVEFTLNTGKITKKTKKETNRTVEDKS